MFFYWDKGDRRMNWKNIPAFIMTIMASNLWQAYRSALSVYTKAVLNRKPAVYRWFALKSKLYEKPLRYNLGDMCRITINFCTYTDSSAVGACAKFYGDRLLGVEAKVKWSHQNFRGTYVVLCETNRSQYGHGHSVDCLESIIVSCHVMFLTMEL